MSPDNRPVKSAERIQSLDILRGIAILGILVMNIQSFSMPGAAYLNPMAYGSMEGVNGWVWTLSHLFADQKFMTIFSILFGAGVVLITQKSFERTGKSAGIHYRRNFWLLIIGLLHAHLLWYGDILVAYAICGFLIYPLRKMKAVYLLILGVILISIHTVFYTFFGTSMEFWPPESLEMAKQSWIPSQELIQEEIAAITGTLSQQIAKVSSSAVFMETFVFLMIFLWRAGGLMLVGMAFYKWGILSATKSRSFYIKGSIIGLILGLTITGYGMYTNFQANFSFEYSMYLGSQWNYWGSLFMAYGYICLIMLFAKTSLYSKIKARLAAVGQMALTNYIAQTVICVFIFFGVGLGFFGQWDRSIQFLVVVVISLMQLVWSKPWLAKYRFGPLEWAWRSLSYRKVQTLKRQQ